MPVTVDYDRIADSYDRRYELHDYSGIAETLDGCCTATDDVLEVGCGTGYWIGRLTRPGRTAVGLDPSAAMLRRALDRREHLTLILGVAEALPFAPRSFDVIVVVNALHHFTEPRRFVGAARRLLRSGGRLVTVGLDPSQGADAWYVYEYFDGTLDADHARYPACGTIRRWMTESGFRDPVTRIAQRIREDRNARACMEEGVVAKHATSQLARLTDEEYQRGLDRIRSEVERAESRHETLALHADLHLFATIGRSV